MTRAGKLAWASALGLTIVGPACSGEAPAAPGRICSRPAAPALLPELPPDESCPSAAELDAVDRDVHISFEGGAEGGDLVCHAANGSRDLPEIPRNVYQAVLLMKRLKFDVPLPWTSLSLYDWFTTSVEGVRVRGDVAFDFCCQPIGVINLRGNSLAINRWAYLTLMVHEARHAQGVPHTCGTLDNTINELGAYGAHYYLMIWVGTHWGEATPAEREFALNRAARLRSSAFCRECAAP